MQRSGNTRKISQGRAPMSGIYGHGTNQEDLRALPSNGPGRGIWTTSTTALAAAGSYIHAVPTRTMQPGSEPIASDTTNGLYICWPMRPHDLVALRIACSHATDPNNVAGSTGRLWLLGGAIGNASGGVSAQDDESEMMGKYGFDLAITPGSQALATGSIFADPATARPVSRWADTIAITNDMTLPPGVMVTGSNGNNAVTEVIFDMDGHRGFALQLACGTALGLLPLYRTI